jgi:hypothetical protein
LRDGFSSKNQALVFGVLRRSQMPVPTVGNCYDHVFPEATWVHIIRPPLDKLNAAARLLDVSCMILREVDRCWEVDLSNTVIGEKLATVADDIGFWDRSPLKLYENDKILGPGHALHYRIRRDGGGKYSHWQNRLLFSTSDNSDPNSNGRVYTFLADS